MIRYVDGQKAVSINDIDNFLQWFVDQNSSGILTEGKIYDMVAFVYRGVQIRAQTIANLPFEILDKSGNQVDSSVDYQNVVGWLPEPRKTFNLIEQSLCTAGYDYWFKEVNRVKLLRIQHWNPYTVKLVPDENDEEGYIGFERTINSKPPVFYPKEVVFNIWPVDYRTEVGPPPSSPVKAALKAGGVLDSIDEFVTLFFERGGVMGALIAAKGMTNPDDRTKLKKWYDKTFKRGNSNSFNSAVVNAETMEVIPIGQGIEALDNKELTQERRESIAVSLGVPMSKFLSNTAAGLGGGGVVEEADIGFYHDLIEPESELIAEEMNKQLFSIGGYTLRFMFETLDVYQVDEHKRSLSWATYVDGGMRREVAATMLGLEIPQDDAVPDWYVDAFVVPEPVPVAIEQADDNSSGVVAEALAAERQQEREDNKSALRDLDLVKWRNKAQKRALEGNPEKGVVFTSEHIEDEVIEQIAYALKYAKSASDVDAVFDGVDNVDLSMLVELKRSNDLLEIAVAGNAERE